MRSAALAVVGAVVLLSWVACERRDAPPESTSAETAPAPPAAPSPATSEQVVELVVEGMHCGTCPITVRTAARSVPGVVDVQVTMSPGRARVRYRPSETDSTRIAAAITDSGYPAHEVNR